MTRPDLKGAISELMRDTGVAHHQAFLSSNGEDPDWPIWYANYLLEPLGKLLSTTFVRSQLIYCLMSVEFERETILPDTDWPSYYADHFIEHFDTTDTASTDKLALYQSPGCPFCVFVRSSIDQLGIDVELRNIHAERKYLDELVEVRKRATVPVLKVTSPEGDIRWIPESQDIVQYLEKIYG